MGMYTKTLEPEEVEDLFKYYCLTRGLKYLNSDFSKRAISIRVLDPVYPIEPEPERLRKV